MLRIVYQEATGWLIGACSRGQAHTFENGLITRLRAQTVKDGVGSNPGREVVRQRVDFQRAAPLCLCLMSFRCPSFSVARNPIFNLSQPDFDPTPAS